MVQGFRFGTHYKPNDSLDISCEISVPLRSTTQPSPYSFAEPPHVIAEVTDHVKRGAFRASGSGLHSPCQHVREKNDANIEEMIADGGFGFHSKAK